MSAGPGAADDTANRWWFGLAVAIVVAVALGIRLYGLDVNNIGLDESVSWFQSKDTFADLLVRTANDNYPPLHNIILFGVIHTAGDSEWLLRFPSVVFGVAAVPALYWLGALTLGRAAGLLAAALLTLSPFHLWYSQEARFYTLMALAAILYAATTLWFLRRPTLFRAACVTLSGLALVYSHPYGTLYWLSIGFALFVSEIAAGRATLRAVAIWMGANAVAGVLFLPWAWHLLGRAGAISRGSFWIPPISRDYLIAQFLLMVPSRPLMVGLLAGVLGALLAPRARGTWMLLVWTAAPIGIGIAVSLVGTSVFHSRYVIASLAPFLLLAAFGLTRYARGWRGAVVALGFVALAVFVFVKTAPYQRTFPDHRGVAAMLTGLPADVCVLLAPAWNAAPFGYYGWTGGRCVIPATSAAQLDGEIPSQEAIGVFNAPLDDNAAGVVRALEAQGFVVGTTTRFVGFEVVEFERK